MLKLSDIQASRGGAYAREFGEPKAKSVHAGGRKSRAVPTDANTIHLKIIIEGLRAVNVSNSRAHWAVKAKEVRKCRDRVRLAMLEHAPPPLPVTVHLTRVGPGNRKLDSDGLVTSFKAVRDEIAACYGIDDADPRIKFLEPAQERGPYAVRVVIER